MADIQEKTLGNRNILFDAEYFIDPEADIFDGQFWMTQDQVIGQAHGRGTTYFFQHRDNEFVLRHYLRGGLIGKVLHDQYLFTGLANTRAWQEFSLLILMREQGLPCPEPVAALVTKRGLAYRADIILKKIANAQDVFTQLQSSALDADIWMHIGAVIKQFHRQGIYHHDLNIHNIMLDAQQQAWLIDFDKCAAKTGSDWQADNLSRLQRSLLKEQSKHNIHWTEADWQLLLTGYQQD